MTLAKAGETFSSGNVYSALLSNIWEIFERQGKPLINDLKVFFFYLFNIQKYFFNAKKKLLTLKKI